MADSENRRDLAIVVPVYNDWSASSILIDRLDEVLDDRRSRWRVILVDDGSNEPPPRRPGFGPLRRIDRVGVLSLRRNLGHQRAIAVGLAYVEAHTDADAVVVMDGDGEDRPSDVPRLLERFERRGGRLVVFAERRRRSEGWRFQAFYHLYRLVHRVMTGVGVRVGNFSVIPRPLLERLVTSSDLWNHYAAAVFVGRVPFDTVPTERGLRFDGRSKMNFVALVVHGLSAISCFRDRVAARLLIASLGALALALLGLFASIAVRLTTDLAIPGWATYTSGLLALMLLQIASSMLVFVFVVLGSREVIGFLPRRDFEHFVGGYRTIASRSPDAEGHATQEARDPESVP